MVTSNQNSSKHSIIIMLHFPDGEMEDLAALNSRVNIKDFQIPEDFDLERVVSAITTVSFSDISDTSYLLCNYCFSMRKDLIDSLMWDSQPIRSFLIVDKMPSSLSLSLSTPLI